MELSELCKGEIFITGKVRCDRHGAGYSLVTEKHSPGATTVITSIEDDSSTIVNSSTEKIKSCTAIEMFP